MQSKRLPTNHDPNRNGQNRKFRRRNCSTWNNRRRKINGLFYTCKNFPASRFFFGLFWQFSWRLAGDELTGLMTQKPRYSETQHCRCNHHRENPVNGNPLGSPSYIRFRTMNPDPLCSVIARGQPGCVERESCSLKRLDISSGLTIVGPPHKSPSAAENSQFGSIFVPQDGIIFSNTSKLLVQIANALCDGKDHIAEFTVLGHVMNTVTAQYCPVPSIESDVGFIENIAHTSPPITGQRFCPNGMGSALLPKALKTLFIKESNPRDWGKVFVGIPGVAVFIESIELKRQVSNDISICVPKLPYDNLSTVARLPRTGLS